MDTTTSAGPQRAAPNVLVINAGTHPEPRHIAVALADAGWNVQYLTGSQFPNTRWIELLVAVAGKRLRLLIGQRVLGHEMTAVKVKVTGFHWEVAFQILKRVWPRHASWAVRRRNRVVSRVSARLVSGRATNLDYVVAQQTTAKRAFESAQPSTAKVLLQPILDTPSLQAILDEEARINPEWAGAIPELPDVEDQLSEIENADLIIAGSEFVAANLRDVLKRHVAVVHYGVAANARCNRRPRRDSSSAFRVLFVGQANQRKGVSYLLDAMDSLSEHSILRIAGHVPDYVRQRVESRSNIDLLGTLNREELNEHYIDSDVLVLPSLGEGFALVALEAMSFGLPCILTPHTGVHEVITDGVNGFVVPIRSATAIADRIRQLAADPVLHDGMRVAARATASRLTWSSFQENSTAVITSFHLSRTRAAARGNMREDESF